MQQVSHDKTPQYKHTKELSHINKQLGHRAERNIFSFHQRYIEITTEYKI